MESILTGSEMSSKNNNNRKTKTLTNRKHAINEIEVLQNKLNFNQRSYPLNSILNRQRTINRSFRTAVDKSFDIPLSGITVIIYFIITVFDFNDIFILRLYL